MVEKPPFEVSETGWGEFEVQMKIYFIDPAEKPVFFKSYTISSSSSPSEWRSNSAICGVILQRGSILQIVAFHYLRLFQPQVTLANGKTIVAAEYYDEIISSYIISCYCS